MVSQGLSLMVGQGFGMVSESRRCFFDGLRLFFLIVGTGFFLDSEAGLFP